MVRGKREMNKSIAKLLIVICLCINFAGFIKTANASGTLEGNDIVITTHTTTPTTVYAGNFTLHLTLSNVGDTELKNVYLIIDGSGESSFTASDGGSVKNIGNLGKSNESNSTVSPSYQITYNGGDNIRLPIRIRYKKGDDTGTNYETNMYLSINAVPNSSISKPEPIDTSKYIPKLSIVGDTIPKGMSGGMISLPIQIKNISNFEAKNITVTPQLGEDTPFEAETLNLSQSISSIKVASTGTINYNFRILGNAATKSYPVKIKIDYENAFGNSYTLENTIYIKVIGQEGSSRLLVKDVYWEKPVLLPGDLTPLNIKIINSGELPLKDIKVSLLGLKEDGFTVYGGSSGQYVGTLNKGQENNLKFDLLVSNKMTTGNYALSIKLEYKDSTGKEESTEQQFFIPVQGEEKQAVKTVPKIIIEQYSSDPSIVKAGQNFQLNMSFLNTSEVKSVKNIKIYLTVNETSTEGANIFTPVNSSNTFFIDNIESKGRVSKSLTLYTIPDAKQKTYTITANIEYEDEEGNEYKATELIGVPVIQQTNIDTSEIIFPPESYPGQPVPVSFDFYNTGKTLLSNFMIRLEGDFQSQNGSYFVGNFDAGSSDHYEAMIIPNAPGQITGAIIISFEDPAGEKSEIRKDFAINVVDMPVEENPGMEPGMEPQTPQEGGIKGILKNKFLWIGAGIVIAAISGIIIRKRVIRKREDMTLDE